MKKIVKHTDPDKEKKESDKPGASKTTNIAPKGARQYSDYKGKRMEYTSLGEGNWEGREIVKPKMRIVKKAPSFDSKKRKVVKRKHGGYTD